MENTRGSRVYYGGGPRVDVVVLFLSLSFDWAEVSELGQDRSS